MHFSKWVLETTIVLYCSLTLTFFGFVFFLSISHGPTLQQVEPSPQTETRRYCNPQETWRSFVPTSRPKIAHMSMAIMPQCGSYHPRKSYYLAPGASGMPMWLLSKVMSIHCKLGKKSGEKRPSQNESNYWAIPTHLQFEQLKRKIGATRKWCSKFGFCCRALLHVY